MYNTRLFEVTYITWNLWRHLWNADLDDGAKDFGNVMEGIYIKKKEKKTNIS